MGKHRNGARSFLDVLAEACRFSHMRGFRAAVDAILGDDVAAELYILWTPLCNFIEALIAADNWWNERDATNDDGPGEDVVLEEVV